MVKRKKLRRKEKQPEISKTRFTEKVITVLVPIKAKTLQGLGIHISVNKDGHSITHLKSGFAIQTKIPSVFKAKTILKRIINEINIDWTKSKEKLFLKTNKEIIKNQIQAIVNDPFSKSINRKNIKNEKTKTKKKKLKR